MTVPLNGSVAPSEWSSFGCSFKLGLYNGAHCGAGREDVAPAWEGSSGRSSSQTRAQKGWSGRAAVHDLKACPWKRRSVVRLTSRCPNKTKWADSRGKQIPTSH